MPRKSDGLYPRRGYYYFKYRDDDNGWREHATHSKSYRDAQRLKAEFLRDLAENRLPNSRADWKLQAAVEHWLADRKLRVAPGSYASELTITRNLRRILGDATKLRALADLTLITRYQSTRLKAGIQHKTVNNEVQVLASILHDANLWTRVSERYKPLRVRKSDVGEALTPEQGGKLIELARFAENTGVAPFAAVLSYATGLRSKEIKQLKLGSIHLDQAQPYLQVHRSTTKTNGGARYVALDTLAVWALRKLMARAKALEACQTENYLLPTQLDKHTRPTDPLHGRKGFDPSHPQASWSNEWDRLRKAVGISHLRFHDLRHSYITRAAEAGVPIAVIQAQVGHLSAAMTDYYTHISQPAIHHAADQIEKHNPELLRKLGLAPSEALGGGVV
jgi:integrase